jgi:hypothetical protein
VAGAWSGFHERFHLTTHPHSDVSQNAWIGV